MSESQIYVTRRKRTANTEVSSSHKSSGSGGLSAFLSIAVILVASVYLMIPSQVDEVLGRTATVISDKNTVTGKAWTSLIMSLTTEDADESAGGQLAAPDVTMLKDGDRVTTGSQGRTLTTRGSDILQMQPQTTITIGDRTPATIVKLLGGTVHVKAGKRHGGDTLSVETQYLVATVKGTEFVVATTDSGTAVSVTEGVVSVRSTQTSQAFDVIPGQTAVVSTAHSLLPTIVATPAGGGMAVLDAVNTGSDRQP